MTEERKHVIDNAGPQNIGHAFWTEQFVSRAINQAGNILEKIDAKWPPEAVTEPKR